MLHGSDGNVGMQIIWEREINKCKCVTGLLM